MVVAGGTPDGVRLMKSVELFIPQRNSSCWLPDLPEAVVGHTSGQRGLTYCGGMNDDETRLRHCVDWRDGGWVRSAELDQPFMRGLIWSREGSSLVMGPTSTVLVTGSKVQPGFDLHHQTVYACGVEDDRNQLIYVVGGASSRRGGKPDISRITSRDSCSTAVEYHQYYDCTTILQVSMELMVTRETSQPS